MLRRVPDWLTRVDSDVVHGMVRWRWLWEPNYRSDTNVHDTVRKGDSPVEDMHSVSRLGTLRSSEGA